MRWSQEEIDIIRLHAPKTPLVELWSLFFQNRTKSSLQNKIYQLDIQRNKSIIKSKYYHNDNYFSNLTISSAYWAGFIAGDGSVSKRGKRHQLRFNLNIKDVCILEKFKEDIGYTGNIKFKTVYRTHVIGHKLKCPYTKYCMLYIYNAEQILNDLEKLNIVPAKTLILTPPPLEGDLALSFIKGLIDSDGSIGYSNNKIYTQFSGTKSMMEWVIDITKKYADNTSKSKVYLRPTLATYQLGEKQSLQVLSNLIKLDTFELSRKWSKIYTRLGLENPHNV